MCNLFGPIKFCEKQNMIDENHYQFANVHHATLTTTKYYDIILVQRALEIFNQ